MAKYQITSPDGQKFEINAPDDASQEQVLSYAQQQFASMPKTAPAPTLEQKIQSSVPGRVAQGARDPIDAGAQLLPRGLEFITSAGGLLPNKASEFFGREAKRVDDMNAQSERAYQAARTATGAKEGDTDIARFVGNVISPVNAGIAKALPIGQGMTTMQKIAQGSTAGTVGAAMQPINELEPGQSFAATKAAQMGLGAVTGGTLGPVLSKVGEKVAHKINAFDRGIRERAVQNADSIIAEELRAIGQKMEDIPQEQLTELRRQVIDSINEGRNLDPAALMRKHDFDAIGVEGTKGQITRDPTQFARERNLRGVSGVGEPIMERFNQQNQRLTEILRNTRGQALEDYPAGIRLSQALENIDESLQRPITSAYRNARNSEGRYAGVNVPQFSAMANQALDEGMLGTYLPAETRNLLNDVSSGKIPLNVNNLVQMDRLLSAAQRKAGQGTPESLAIGKVRDALNSADIEHSAGEASKNSFDFARGLARQRFDLHRAIPALERAANGEINPDTFVQRFIINGNTDEVRRLADLLRNGVGSRNTQPSSVRAIGNNEATSPSSALSIYKPNLPSTFVGGELSRAGDEVESGLQSLGDIGAFNEAKAQIGKALYKKAFGQNAAGDKIFTPERYAEALENIGTDKLRAFFNQNEIDELKRVGRVGSYINSVPTASPVNYSNTGALVSNLVGKIPGIPASAALLSKIGGVIGDSSAAKKALDQTIPQQASQLTPEQIQMMTRLLSIGAPSAGAASGSSLR